MKKALLNLVLIVSVVLLNSCNKDGNNTDPKNQAPETFGLIGVSNGATDVDVMPSFSWTAATDPDGDAVTYDLYIDSNKNPTTLFAEDITTTSHQLEEPLSLTTEYFWKVIAKDNKGNSTTSKDTYSFTTRNTDSANQAPATFGLIGVSNGATDVDVMPSFSWAAATDPDGDAVTYDLYIDSNENPTTLFAEDIASTSYQLQEPLALTNQYYWKVVAKDNNGGSTESDATYGFTTRNLNFPNTPATANAPFGQKLDHTTVVFDNKLWVIGGSDGFLSYKNDVWYSENGSTWKQATSNAAFSERYRHTTVVFNDKLWVIGGWDGDNKNDVWNSEDGVTWTQVTANAGFSKRNHHTTVVFDNKLWVIGGITDGLAAGRENDVWYSTDGSNWVEATASAAFPKRAVHTSVVYDDKIWVIGGYDGPRKNDVWYSTDGSTWVQATENAAFNARSDHTTVVFNNRLWVIGGFDGGPENDVWFSADGDTWTQAAKNAAFTERNGHSTAVFNNKIWVIAGFDGLIRRDVWYMD